MCDKANTIIDVSRNGNNPLLPLYTFLIKPCDCKYCDAQYKKNAAILKIRNLFRRKLKHLNKNSKNLNNYEKQTKYVTSNWITSCYNNINDINSVIKIL